MATITPVNTLRDFDEPSTIEWTAITHTDDGGIAPMTSGFKRGTCMLNGTFDGSGNYKVEGSIDGTNFSILKDIHGNSLSATSGSASYEFETAARYLRIVRSGGAATSVNVQIIYYLKRETYERISF